MSEHELALLEHFGTRLINKLLHSPTSKLRQLSEGGASSQELLNSLEILGLVDGEDE